MRLIDADALIENFGKLTVELWLDSVEEAEIVSLIGNAPTIEPKRGEWINKHEWSNGFFERECSVCGAMKPQLMHTAKINFCPNCGADMRGENNETDKEMR